MRIRTKRVYESLDPADGRRILVDRLWPRGVSKAAARIDYWAKATAPSTPLRRWYGHDPDKWKEFRRRYFAELTKNSAGLADLRRQLGKGTVTFVFGSKEERLNDATALREFIMRRAGAAPAR
jgi:uncharacterized protein YeaO (DUF488 family)